MGRFPHFLIQSTAQKHKFVSTISRGSEFKIPPRDRVAHGTKLAESLKQIEVEVQNEIDKPAVGVSFVPIVVSSDPEFDLKLERLDNKLLGMKVINVRNVDDDSQVAIIHIPKDKFSKFSKKIEDYAQKNLSKKGNPPNQELVASINQIRLAKLQNGDYWTDSGPMPSVDEVFWWEVWLRNDLETSSSSPVEEQFREEATKLGIRVSKRRAEFPGFVIVLAYTSLNVFIEFPGLLRYLAEFRRASLISPREFLDLPPAGQSEYINAMLERTTFASDSAPSICILDGGVNRGHPLLEQALLEKHNIAYDDRWTSADLTGHGTQMAGLALFGDKLNELLFSKDNVLLGHRLESVKILPDKGVNDPPDYGPITAGSVAKMEVESSQSFRVTCMAVTAGDKELWLPTLWSATIDQMCSGALDDHRRLMIVSAGNHSSELLTENYPRINRYSSIQDPAQAWNTVTVGAHTEKVLITDPDLSEYKPLAKNGALSPRSTTSFSWEDQAWPIKPDIVMEGGNYAAGPGGRVSDVEDLSLLTTRLSSDSGALLTSIRDTSAATALAARFAAIIAAEYPNLWPESIRGLLIHTASWSKEMLKEFPQKKDRQNLLRCYGYGVPNLEAARQCASNRATLILQETLLPFYWDEDKNKPITNEMNIHELPWPVLWLQGLGELKLRMRVTLSYFIEPSPGRLGWDVKHRYQSHGLRFDVKRPEEDIKHFRERLSKAEWENKNKPETIDDSRKWDLGSNLRTKGTIHSDWWSGTAAKLAASGYIAIYPVKGWWSERPNQKAFNKQARYSLIITLESEDRNVPIYNEVATIIASRNLIPIEIF